MLNQKDAKGHLQSLVELLKGHPAADGGNVSTLSKRRSCEPSPSRYEPGALAVALGNLGVVCRELGEAEEASGLLEASLNAASSSTTNDSVRCHCCTNHQVEHSGRGLSLRNDFQLPHGWISSAPCIMQGSIRHRKQLMGLAAQSTVFDGKNKHPHAVGSDSRGANARQYWSCFHA